MIKGNAIFQCKVGGDNLDRLLIPPNLLKLSVND